MKQKFTQFYLSVTLIMGLMFTSSVIHAQEEVKLSKEDSLGNVLKDARKDLDILKKLKISGYILAEWQKADTAGIGSFAGGNFPANSNNRYMVREARIKFLYGTDLNQFVMQFDVSEKGLSTKDMYFKMTDPIINWFSLYAGIMNRPFGWEIAYSSANRESPERARFTQTLFPGERDLGAQLSINPNKNSPLNFIHLDAGLFNGNGINPETDNKKDFIGHLWISKTNRNENISYGLGVSLYNGYVFQGTKYVYKMGDVATGVKGFVVDSTSTNKTKFATRQYIGFDGQFSIVSPIGLSVLRGEYVFGTQPGSNATSTSPTVAINYDTYIRKFNAFYVYFVQNIAQTKHQIVIKYDVYDPNTDIAGTGINGTINGKKTKLGTTDIKYSTLGLGYLYHFNNNIKFELYYDLVSNEVTGIKGTTALNNYTKDLADNVLTLRLTYKF